MKKILFFDIDGTLAYPRQDPSPATVEAIRQARKKGHYAFISTGRTSDSIPEAVRRIGFDGGIFSAGGEIRVKDGVLAMHCMERDILAKVIACLEKYPVLYVLETAEGRFCRENARAVLALTDMTGIGSGDWALTEGILFDPGMKPMAQYRGQGVFKIAYYCPKDNTAVRFCEELAGTAKVVAFSDFPALPISLGEISDPNVNKGRAVAEICRHFHMSTDDSIAFGDSMNDAEMLEAAGLGIAMGNAAPQVKALADRVCGCCEEDGVARALQELNLI